jgi:hypothetical protein
MEGNGGVALTCGREWRKDAKAKENKDAHRNGFWKAFSRRC